VKQKKRYAVQREALLDPYSGKKKKRRGHHLGVNREKGKKGLRHMRAKREMKSRRKKKIGLSPHPEGEKSNVACLSEGRRKKKEVAATGSEERRKTPGNFRKGRRADLFPCSGGKKERSNNGGGKEKNKRLSSLKEKKRELLSERKGGGAKLYCSQKGKKGSPSPAILIKKGRGKGGRGARHTRRKDARRAVSKMGKRFFSNPEGKHVRVITTVRKGELVTRHRGEGEKK